MVTKKTKSYVALFLTVVFWGLAYPALSNIMAAGMSVGTLNIFRFGSAFLLLLPFAISSLKHLTKRDLWLSLACEMLLFGGFLCITLALAQVKSSPGITALVVGMGIFVVPLLSFLVLKKKTPILSIVGVIVAFVGIMFFNYTGEGVTFTFSLSLLYSLLSALFFGIHIFVLATYSKKSNERIVSTLQLLVVFVLFGLYVSLFEPHSFTFNFHWFVWAEVLFLGIFSTGLAYFFQTYASKYMSADVCNIILGLESFFAVLFSVLFGLEIVTLPYVIGSVLVLVGTVLVIKEESEEEKSN